MTDPKVEGFQARLAACADFQALRKNPYREGTWQNELFVLGVKQASERISEEYNREERDAGR